MKKVLCGLFMTICISVFSQNDSTSLAKNEVSIYCNVFKIGFGARYAYWYSPEHYLSAVIDVNSIGTPYTKTGNDANLKDSTLTIGSYLYRSPSVGIKLGAGYIIKYSNPKILFTAGIMGGVINKQTWRDESVNYIKKDSLYNYLNGTRYELPIIHGLYAGAFGTISLLADISKSLKFYASADLSFCYIHYNQKNPTNTEFSLNETVSLGLTHFF